MECHSIGIRFPMSNIFPIPYGSSRNCDCHGQTFNIGSAPSDESISRTGRMDQSECLGQRRILYRVSGHRSTIQLIGNRVIRYIPYRIKSIGGFRTHMECVTILINDVPFRTERPAEKFTTESSKSIQRQLAAFIRFNFLHRHGSASTIRIKDNLVGICLPVGSILSFPDTSL